MSVPRKTFSQFTDWLDRMKTFTITQDVDGVSTEEVPVSDWRAEGGRLVYLPPFTGRPHTLELTELREDGDNGWILVSAGITFTVGYVWTDEQQAILDGWAAERVPEVVDAALSSAVTA